MTLDIIKTPENSFFPIHNHTHYSDGYQTPKKLAKKCKELGYKACAITDIGAVSGCIEFLKACKKEEIKGILGIELNLTYLPANIHDDNNLRTQRLIILAKNEAGWKSLIKITSRSYDDDMYHEIPRLDFETLKELWNDNLIAISGHEKSSIANALFKDDIVYTLNNKDDILDLIVPNVHNVLHKRIEEHKEIFGDNFFIGIDDSIDLPIKRVISEVLRGNLEDDMLIALNHSFYSEQGDVKDHRLVTCVRNKTTFKNINKVAEVQNLFRTDEFYIQSPEEISKNFDENEISNLNKIFDLCENYSLDSRPSLPKYKWTDGLSESEYLKSLCRIGWQKKLIDRGVVKEPNKKQEYLDRFLYELGVLEEADLVGYFLIVQDYINWCKNQGILIGPGRGSAGGSLICYLLNITEVDPIKYGLMFERFYNKGRNTEDNIEYPDIDVDFPKMFREKVIDYVRDKYGDDKVCQMVTFSTMQGRKAMKDVLRMHEVVSFSEMNKICAKIPDKAEISDKLEESGEESIIRWTLYNQPKKLEDYCTIDDEGNLHGELSEYFAQAIRLEGVIIGHGKHAAGVIISPEKLDDSCPMIRDKDGNKIAGLDMKTLASSHVKFDFLGLVNLDKLMEVNKILRGELWMT